MPGTEGKLPVFLGDNPFGGPCTVPVIAVAEFKEEGDISIVIKADTLKAELPNLIETEQIRGLALNVAYRAPAAKKENDNGRT
jgi:hypothetical protein